MTETYKVSGTHVIEDDGSWVQHLVGTRVPDPPPIEPPIDGNWITRLDFSAGDIPRKDLLQLQMGDHYSFKGGGLTFRPNPDNEKLDVNSDGELFAIRDKHNASKHHWQFLPLVADWQTAKTEGVKWFPPLGSTIRLSADFECIGIPKSWMLPFQFYADKGQTKKSKNPVFAPFLEGNNGKPQWVLRLRSGDRTLGKGGEIMRAKSVPYVPGKQSWQIVYKNHATDGHIHVTVGGTLVWAYSGCTILTTSESSAAWATTIPIGLYTYSQCGVKFSKIKIEEQDAKHE